VDDWREMTRNGSHRDRREFVGFTEDLICDEEKKKGKITGRSETRQSKAESIYFKHISCMYCRRNPANAEDQIT